MDYLKIYKNLIEISQNKNRNKSKELYYEKHHILPRCLGGSDDENNLVLLTAREHFIAHKLLTYIYKRNFKIACAFNLMVFMNDRKYRVTSRDYQYVRELYALTPIDEETREKLKNIFHTKEWNYKISKTLKNHAVSYETRQKISAAGKGRKATLIALENYKKGNKEKNKGVKHQQIECEYCHKYISLNNHTRWHGKKCKVNE